MADWSPGIGDPTPLGWLTVVAYLAAAAFTVRAGARDPRNAGPWLGIAVFLALLAINKQLDLQSLLTDLARDNALLQGWYDQRRRVQAIFIFGLLAIAAGAALWLLWLTHGRGPALRVATFGLTFLLVFIVARAASFHHMDEVLRVTFVAMTLNHFLEIGGIAVVGLAAAMVRQRSARPTNGSQRLR
jgi:hypothetical protein